MLGQVQAPPLGVHERTEGFLEVLGHLHRARRGVVRRRVAIGGEVGLSQRPHGQALDLGQGFPRRLGIHLGERTCAEAVCGTEDLEEVELDVPEVGAVVRHGDSLRSRIGLPVGVTRQ